MLSVTMFVLGWF